MATQNGINFNNVIARTVTRKGASIITTADNVENGKYVYGGWEPAVMALDIDWCGADLSAIGSQYSSIQTTGQLLSAIIAAANKAASTTGPQGPRGYQGETGAQGPKGVQGATGAQGPIGTQGLPGQQGAQGKAGVQGPQGYKGAQGETGPQGRAGVQGASGPQGVQGKAGAQGIAGAAGAQGAQGPKGAQGLQGATGAQGPQGARGLAGAQGATGSTESSINTHYTPSSGYKTYKQANKVIESITVDQKGHVISVTYAPAVQVKNIVSIDWTNLSTVNGTVNIRPSLGTITVNFDDNSSEIIDAYDSGVTLSNANFYKAAGTYNLTASYEGFTTTNAKTVIMTQATPQPTTNYYYYVGPNNPLNMSSISPVVTSQAEAGWYNIGTSIGTYSLSRPLLDASENMIPMGSKTNDYVALPNSTLKIYNGLGISEMDAYTFLGTKVFDGVTYYIYQDNTAIRYFSQYIY